MFIILQLTVKMIIMKKQTAIIILQIITLLLVIVNHFLPNFFFFRDMWNLQSYWFGIKVDSLIVDIILYTIIALQLLIIILLLDSNKEPL